MKKLDCEAIDFGSITLDSLSEVEIRMDLGKLELKNQVHESFDDLIDREQYKTGNLFQLNKLRLLLKANGTLKLINTYNGKINDAYLYRQEMLLNKAGFVHIKITCREKPLIIEAVKRPLEEEEQDFGLKLVEVIHPEEILRCHDFAREYYYYKDFNYDLEVVKQFDLNSDLFVLYDSAGDICSIARLIIRVPDYYCSFMYATQATEPKGAHYSIPEKHLRTSEIMALYREGKKGVVSFKYLMEYLTQYGTKIGHFDNVWTTYDECDNYTGTYYKNKFLMRETGVKLIYRDFGGLWNLLVTEQMEALAQLHHKIFRQ